MLCASRSGCWPSFTRDPQPHPHPSPHPRPRPHTHTPSPSPSHPHPHSSLLTTHYSPLTFNPHPTRNPHCKVRLLAPFTRDAGLLREVFTADLAKALRAPRATIRIVELRLSAEYATVDLLPPDAFAKARRFHRLIRSPGSILFSGQAARAIDGAVGLTQLLTDGTAARFAPPDTFELPTVDSMLATVDEIVEQVPDVDRTHHPSAACDPRAHHSRRPIWPSCSPARGIIVEQAIGIGPSQPGFWHAAAALAAAACTTLCLCAAAVRRLRAARRRPLYHYSRSLQAGSDEERDDDDESALLEIREGSKGKGGGAGRRPSWRRVHGTRTRRGAAVTSDGESDDDDDDDDDDDGNGGSNASGDDDSRTRGAVPSYRIVDGAMSAAEGSAAERLQMAARAAGIAPATLALHTGARMPNQHEDLIVTL